MAAVLLLAVYNANLRGIGSQDTRATEYEAYSLAAHGTADVNSFPTLRETGIARGYVQEVDGHFRVAYPIVAALVAAPAYWVAVRAGAIDRRHPAAAGIEAIGKLVASALTATAMALLVLLISARVPDAPALLIALAAGLATSLWSSASQALWSHAPAACFLALGLLLVGCVPARTTPDGDRSQGARAPTPPDRAPKPAEVSHGGRDLRAVVVAPMQDRPPGADVITMAVAGVLFGLAGACRPLLVVFPLCAASGLAVWRRTANALVLLAGAAAVLAALAACNLALFGTVLGGLARLESAAVHGRAHAVGSAWSGNLVTGLAGILLSPNRGLVVFTPVVLLAVPGAHRLWRTDRLARWTLILPTGLFLLGWSKDSVWWGGHSYGPRYAADVAVPLAVMAAAGLARCWNSASARAAKTTIVLALAWSIAVQAIGAFCYPGGDWNGSPADVDRAHGRLWDWRDTEIGRTLEAGVYRRGAAGAAVTQVGDRAAPVTALSGAAP